tara:strand:- start:1262 stop:1585 length:324 start_codon:yes stop_codon:yes gene_type:complete
MFYVIIVIAMKQQTNTFKVKNAKELEKVLKNFTKNKKGVFTASVVFDTVFVKSFNFLSQVNSAQIDDSPANFKGFWKNGKFFPFTDEFIKSKNKPNKKNKFAVFGGG